jgi:hypothetical protein
MRFAFIAATTLDCHPKPGAKGGSPTRRVPPPDRAGRPAEKATARPEGMIPIPPRPDRFILSIRGSVDKSTVSGFFGLGDPGRVEATRVPAAQRVCETSRRGHRAPGWRQHPARCVPACPQMASPCCLAPTRRVARVWGEAAGRENARQVDGSADPLPGRTGVVATSVRIREFESACRRPFSNLGGESVLGEQQDHQQRGEEDGGQGDAQEGDEDVALGRLDEDARPALGGCPSGRPATRTAG